jgi:putative membrane protein
VIQKVGVKILQHGLSVIKGAIVGAGAILPGISGGVLCVTFGIYRPMMALLSHPIRSFKVYYSLFVPFLIGWITGFLYLARVVEWLFNASSVLAIALFVGLIGGTLPSLFRDAGKKGVTLGSWTGFSISLIVLFAFLSYFNTTDQAVIDATLWWFFFCGAIWGLSLVIPGLSSSSILIFMGLYQPMTAGIAALDFRVILPLLAGLALTVSLTARIVNHLYEKHYSLISHIILGIVIASTLRIVPINISGAGELVLVILCFVLGYGISWVFDFYGQRFRKQELSGVPEAETSIS